MDTGLQDAQRSFLKRIGSSVLVGAFTTIASRSISRCKNAEAACVGLVAAATTSVTLLGFNHR